MEHPEELVGRLLDGRYLLHAVIGNGGSAVVFCGEDLLLQRSVAIKMLRGSTLVVPSAQGRKRVARSSQREKEAAQLNRESFLRESLSAAMLSHPSIVTVYDVCPDPVSPYIVMELINGQALSHRIADLGVLPLRELLSIARRILEALDEAHAHGVVHRDIKAQNILLTTSGEVKVTDFGIAEIDGRHFLRPDGKAQGTADTMSPEQASGARVDARSDLYSLGVLLYQMATGYLPFEDDDPQTVAFLHVTEPPRYPSTLNPDIPRGLEQIILTALEKEPDKRFPSAAAMLMAVQRLERSPGHVFRRMPRQRTRAWRRSAARTPWWAALAGGLTALAIFAMSLLLSGGFW